MGRDNAGTGRRAQGGDVGSAPTGRARTPRWRNPPQRRIDAGKARVARGREIDLGDVEPSGARDRLRVDFAAARDDDLVDARGARLRLGEAQRRVDVARDFDAFGRIGFIARDDDEFAPRQRPADRLKGLAADDQRLAHRQRLEALEIARKPPRQGVARADDAVARHRSDQREARRAQTATGALIAGQGS
jgi:hypothetical protein